MTLHTLAEVLCMKACGCGKQGGPTEGHLSSPAGPSAYGLRYREEEKTRARQSFVFSREGFSV